ncbi:MAG: hypothetical protein MRY76_07860 [Pseudomonadales bacterium]|nr:hypothetical protein [Pseudomonadales bacterium]
MAITAETRTDLIEIVVGMFGAAPGASVLAELTTSIEAGTSLRDLTITLANSTVFKAAYPNFLTNEEFATNFLTSILGSNVSQEVMDEAVAIAVTELNGGMSRGDLVWLVIDFMDTIAEDDANLGTAATAFNNKVEVAEYYSVTLNLSASTLDDLEAVIENVDETDASVTSAKAVADGTKTAGETFTLTKSVDNIVGTTGDDTINGAEDTVTGLDKIDGGAGEDTLVVNDVTGTAAAGANFGAVSSVKNVESLVLTSVEELRGGALDVSAWTGLESATVALQSIDAAQTITAGATTDVTLSGNVDTAADITVSGGHAVDISIKDVVDNSGKTITVTGGSGTGSASVTQTTATGSEAFMAAVKIDDKDAATDTKLGTLASATINGLHGGTAAINSDALTELTVANSSKGITIDNDTAKHSLDLSLNNVTGGTIADVVATTVNVETTGKKSTGVTLSNTLATALNISGDQSLSAALGTQATGLTITSTSTGGVTITSALDTDVTYTGSDAADAITLGATTKTITTGGGDDKVTLSAGVTALGTGGSIDAGDGSADTLAFADADDAGTASAGATFQAKIAGFEVVELAGAAGAGVTVDLDNLDDLSAVKFSADVAQAVGITNMTTGGSLTVTNNQTGATTVTIKDAATNTADTFNIAIAGSAAVAANSVTVNNTETVNISTDDTATTTTSIEHTLTLVADKVASIVVSGDAGLTLTNTNTTVTSFDASGVTDGDVTWTTGALAKDATITGSSTEINTFDTSASSKKMTITTGAAADSITTGAGADTINAGAGDDTIIIGTGLDMITGGDGKDTFDFNGIATNGNTYAEIQDFATGDKLDFVGISDAAIADVTNIGAAITLAGTAVFQDYLDAAAAGDGSAAGLVNWFQFGGDTYIVVDNEAAATFQNAGDHVLKLTGAIDLSGADIATEILTL